MLACPVQFHPAIGARRQRVIGSTLEDRTESQASRKLSVHPSVGTEKQGGLNGSTQHLLGVYLQESDVNLFRVVAIERVILSGGKAWVSIEHYRSGAILSAASLDVTTT